MHDLPLPTTQRQVNPRHARTKFSPTTTSKHQRFTMQILRATVHNSRSALLLMCALFMTPGCSAETLPAEAPSDPEEEVGVAEQELRGCNDYLNGAVHESGTCADFHPIDCPLFCLEQKLSAGKDCYPIMDAHPCTDIFWPNVGNQRSWLQTCYCQKCPRDFAFYTVGLPGSCVPGAPDVIPPVTAAHLALNDKCKAYCGSCNYANHFSCTDIAFNESHFLTNSCSCFRQID